MSVRLLVLSDSHLFQSKGKELFRVNTFRALKIATDQIRAQSQEYDLLVALGDLAEDGSEGAYNHFHALTHGLAESTVWVRGNHDDFDNIGEERLSEFFKPELHLGPWHLIFLDTTIQGRGEGRLDPAELRRLESFLKSFSGGHILIFMHHQPLPVGSAFIDELALQNREKFLTIVDGCKAVKGIIFGHVHQQLDAIHNGIRFLSMPSTSIQFKPRSANFELDDPGHGYREVILLPDGTLDTSVLMVAPGS